MGKTCGQELSAIINSAPTDGSFTINVKTSMIKHL